MVTLNDTKSNFSLGQVVATPGALAAFESSGETPQLFLRRHASGDWGDVSAEDHQASLAGGERLLSSYRTALGTKIWIITEADRSATTLLLPDEY